MAQLHTHYDNLKVARNAPPEVIRAAYRTLSQKFHPDRNPGNPESERVMAIINTSYDVLSDPDKRQKHDLWIAQQERLSAQPSKPNNSPPPIQPKAADCPPQPKGGSGGVFGHILRNWLPYGVITLLIWSWATDKPRTAPTGPKPYQATPLQTGPKPYQVSPAPPVQPPYVRPNAAPNGQPWPTSPAYIKGYQLLHADGLSSATIDNSRNNSDVYVKLVSLDSSQAYAVRQFFIPAFRTFTLNKVTAGSYDIRYRDLGNGRLSRSEPFSLEEVKTHNGTQFTNITITLYKVQNGNMQTYNLSEAEF